MRLLPYGDSAVLVELADAAERRRLDAALHRAALAQVVEHVPGAQTVLVRAASAGDVPALAGLLRTLDWQSADEDFGTDAELVIPTRYDGPDLPEVATLLGSDPAEVVARHTGQAWTVEFMGFAPGFGYLLGERGGLEVPRRVSPRTRIPSGAVGLAGPYSGVYPRASPGGWQLLGTTDLRMWDQRREPPALLAPGMRVRFEATS